MNPVMTTIESSDLEKNDFPQQQDVSGVELAKKFQNDFEKLQQENSDLRKDKSILEEIINEKDKLINNLQLQIDNLQNFSSSIKTPIHQNTIIDPPPRSAQRQFRSISNPVHGVTKNIDEVDKIEDIKENNEDEESLLNMSRQSTSNNNDETITEETAQEDKQEIRDIPQRNPNHRIPPITLENDSPAKSVASSNYSPQREDDKEEEATPSNIETPIASPTRPSAQQAHFMGIPVSEMVWGSSPGRNISPNRGRNPPLSPLKNQLFTESTSTIQTPNLGNDEDDEFIFSPMGGSNGSLTNIVKMDHPRSSTISTSSVQRSITSEDFDHVKTNNELENVVQYMDKRLSVKNYSQRSRASTANSVLTNNRDKQLLQRAQTPPSFDRSAIPNLATLKLPSESNISNFDRSPISSAGELNPFGGGKTFENDALVTPQHIVSTPATTRNVSTPATYSSSRFDNFDEDELKGLMVRPNDLETTLIAVVSVIDNSVPSGKKKADDPAMTFGCFLVESSGERREIFKFSKTYSQLLEFDSIVRSHFFELLPLPEISSFLKTTPNTIEFRRQILNNYFYKLYELKIKPKDLALAICRFVSTDPVFQFDFNENIVKEGYMLRKGSGKLNTTWKVFFCSVYGSSFELMDQVSNKKQVLSIPECKLINEEDSKDVRHGISIIEPRKNVLSSSYNRIVLCAESYEDKLEWLEALAKSSSNLNPAYIKSSSESMLSVPSADMSPDTSLRYNNSFNNSKLSSPSVSDAPATPMAQSYAFDDASTLNSVTKPRKRGGLFGLKKDKSGGKTTSPDKFDGMITPSTAIEPVTNLESYQQQQQQQQQQQSQYVLPSATDSTFTFSSYSPTKSFPSGPELFGASLETAIELSSTEYKGKIIPSICFRCIDYLERKNAVYSEGIFRLTGKSSEINLLNELFNYKYDVDFNELEKLPDVDSISTLLKRYLRSLKESVITPELASVLKQLPETYTKLLFFKENVSTLLPKINYDLLYVLLDYLIKVIKNKEFNKMDINNITMLFSVNFNVDEDVLSELIIDFNYIFNDASNPVPTDERPFLRR